MSCSVHRQCEWLLLSLVLVASPAGTLTAAGQTTGAQQENADVAGHSLDYGILVVDDLSHGLGSKNVGVRRIWRGGALTSHFGPGWSDPNLLRLTPYGSDALIVWLGESLSKIANRESDAFRTDDGETIRKTDDGWTYSRADGTSLTCDNEGRVRLATSVAGRASHFGYDEEGLTYSRSLYQGE